MEQIQSEQLHYEGMLAHFWFMLFSGFLINFQLIMDQNDFMSCEVSSSIRCDQICRVSHFRTRHFNSPPTSCCCSFVVPVAWQHRGGGGSHSAPLATCMCSAWLPIHHQLHAARQPGACSSAWGAVFQPGWLRPPHVSLLLHAVLCAES